MTVETCAAKDRHVVFARAPIDRTIDGSLQRGSPSTIRAVARQQDGCAGDREIQLLCGDRPAHGVRATPRRGTPTCGHDMSRVAHGILVLELGLCESGRSRHP
jgi:hypothetical protein